MVEGFRVSGSRNLDKLEKLFSKLPAAPATANRSSLLLYNRVLSALHLKTLRIFI